MLDESQLPENSFASETTVPKKPVTTNHLDAHAPRSTPPAPVDSDVFEIEKILNTRQREGRRIKELLGDGESCPICSERFFFV